MDRKSAAEFARELRRRRDTLFKEVADTESDLRSLGEARESELEERAQADRAARLLAALDLRGKREIEEIDAALQRIEEGVYGVCLECGSDIALDRLRAVPAARFCLSCEREHERRMAALAEEREVVHPRVVPPELGSMTDRDAEMALREMVREDGRIDTEELRLVYRHGIVYLDGAVPSENEHQMLLKLLTDVAGIGEVADRLQVKEILWERPEPGEAMPPAEAAEVEAPAEPAEAGETEDVVLSEQEGVEYVPPVVPPEEER